MDAGDSQPQRGELCSLIVHQGDEGRDDEGCAAAGDGGQLIAEGFSGPSRHDEQDITAVGRSTAYGFLVGAEA